MNYAMTLSSFYNPIYALFSSSYVESFECIIITIHIVIYHHIYCKGNGVGVMYAARTKGIVYMHVYIAAIATGDSLQNSWILSDCSYIYS